MTRHMVRWQKKCINRERLTLIRYQNMQKTSNTIRKEGLRNYADVTIYTVCKTRMVLTTCHHKHPTTIVISLAF